jgi:hypothetical protein
VLLSVMLREKHLDYLYVQLLLQQMQGPSLLQQMQGPSLLQQMQGPSLLQQMQGPSLLQMDHSLPVDHLCQAILALEALESCQTPFLLAKELRA